VRDDNRVQNLAWKTARGNADDRDRHGHTLRGDAHPFRLHPELTARGDRNGSRKYPERLKRGNENPRNVYYDRYPKGEQFHTAKLTADLVREIRRRYAAGEGSQRVLAAEYGIALSSLRQVVVRLSWKHVE
jgi:hypothetical protein